MHEYKDPTRITRVAVVAVIIYLAVESAYGLATLFAFTTAPYAGSQLVVVADLVAGLNLLTLLGCSIVVGTWIYRVSANAHSFSDEMTISPGWAVGWYFVPFANLVKPFEGMKEVWLATFFRSGWHGEATPGLLGWWWGLWLVTNILANLAGQISYRAGAMSGPAVWLDVAAAALNVPLCLILIRMMRRISDAQRYARHDETFA